MVVVVIMVVMMMMMVIWWGPTGTTLVCCRESFTGRSDNRCVKEKKSLLYRNATQKLAMLSASLTIANVEDWSSTSLLILLVLHSLAATNLPLLSNFFLSSHDVRAWLGDKKTNYFSCSLTEVLLKFYLLTSAFVLAVFWTQHALLFPNFHLTPHTHSRNCNRNIGSLITLEQILSSQSPK